MNHGPTVAPPGGLYVYDRNGERVESYTSDGAVRALTNLRKANTRPIGDPERDCLTEFARKYGGYHSPISAGEIAPLPTVKKNLTQRLGDWLNKKYKYTGMARFVSLMEAERRAKICFNCPKNKEWRTGCRSCSPMIPNMEHQVTVISQARHTKLDRRLFACDVAAHENRVAVHLAKSSLNHVNPNAPETGKLFRQLPSFCWLRKLHEPTPSPNAPVSVPQKSVGAKDRRPASAQRRDRRPAGKRRPPRHDSGKPSRNGDQHLRADHPRR